MASEQGKYIFADETRNNTQTFAQKLVDGRYRIARLLLSVGATAILVGCSEVKPVEPTPTPRTIYPMSTRVIPTPIPRLSYEINAQHPSIVYEQQAEYCDHCFDLPAELIGPPSNTYADVAVLEHYNSHGIWVKDQIKDPTLDIQTYQQVIGRDAKLLMQVTKNGQPVSDPTPITAPNSTRQAEHLNNIASQFKLVPPSEAQQPVPATIPQSSRLSHPPSSVELTQQQILDVVEPNCYDCYDFDETLLATNYTSPDEVIIVNHYNSSGEVVVDRIRKDSTIITQTVTDGSGSKKIVGTRNGTPLSPLTTNERLSVLQSTKVSPVRSNGAQTQTIENQSKTTVADFLKKPSTSNPTQIDSHPNPNPQSQQPVPKSGQAGGIGAGLATNRELNYSSGQSRGTGSGVAASNKETTPNSSTTAASSKGMASGGFGGGMSTSGIGGGASSSSKATPSNSGGASSGFKSSPTPKR